MICIEMKESIRVEPDGQNQNHKKVNTHDIIKRK